MPRIKETTVYAYSELSENAKESARNWYRNSDCDSFWSEHVIDDAADIADMLGIDLRQTRKTRMDNTHFYAPTIYYSGFSSQGDGACFESTYKYKPGALKAIQAHAPTDKRLQGIAKELQDIQKRYFYKLTAATKHRGHYYHSGCMSVDVEHSDDSYRDIGTAESDITDALRSFADWIYNQLEKEYEWCNSDEQVTESIEANEYEFDEDGSIA